MTTRGRIGRNRYRLTWWQLGLVYLGVGLAVFDGTVLLINALFR